MLSESTQISACKEKWNTGVLAWLPECPIRLASLLFYPLRGMECSRALYEEPIPGLANSDELVHGSPSVNLKLKDF